MNDQYPLPIHFFTIVLNGEPFIRHHLEVFRRLKIPWRWHVIEGVAELRHDTAWSLSFGGRIPSAWHRDGQSVDGTTEYLDRLAREEPDRVILHRKPRGEFWDGKREMVQAPLACLPEECLLWQVDSDELWTTPQLEAAHQMFLENPERKAAYYRCHYFVGPRLVTTTRETYGNQSGEWLRTWRYRRGCSWQSHEPPRLCDGSGTDLAGLQPFRQDETEARGLVFQHFAYATEAQLKFKEEYYGYQNALKCWQTLQMQFQFPVKLQDYFPWVQDSTQVDRVDRLDIQPLAWEQGGRWFLEKGDPSGVEKILFIRTDSIGDNLLAASMLEPIQKKYPHARITIVCQERVRECYETSPWVKEIISFDRDRCYQDEGYRQEIVAKLKDQHADLVLNSVYSREPLTDILAVGSGGRERVAFQSHHCNLMTVGNRDACDRHYTRLLSGGRPHQPELERHHDFLEGLGIQADRLGPTLWLTDADEKFADEFFKENGLKAGEVVALHAGAQWQEKFYPGWREVVGSIHADHPGPMLALGSASENGLHAEIFNGLDVPVVHACGKATLRQTAALIKRCRITVGVDSAIAHMAVAVGTPNVVVMGGGHFGRFLPYSALTGVVCLPLECYGCSWSCKWEKPHCTQEIAPSVVVEAVRRMMQGKPGRPRIFVQMKQHGINGEGGPPWMMFGEFLDTEKVEIIPVGNMDGEIQSSRVRSGEYWSQVGRALESIQDLRRHGHEEKAQRAAAYAIGKFPRAIHLRKLSEEMKAG